MPTNRTTFRGRCFLCGFSSTKGGITRHLKKHIAEYQGKTPLVWVRVTDQTPWNASGLSKAYWLDLEMPTYLTLAHLDEFLRAVWVECCGHLSRFFVRQGQDEVMSFEHLSEDDLAEEEMVALYKKDPKKLAQRVAREKGVSYAEAQKTLALWALLYLNRPERRDIHRTTLSTLLKMTNKWEYEYDYGTTTHLHLKVMARYHGPKPPANAPIRILSRNYKPVIPCAECGQPADYWEMDEGWPRPLCKRHIEENDSEYYLPIVNSPRTGLCGYDSTASLDLTFEVYSPDKET